MATLNTPYAPGFRQDTEKGATYVTPYAITVFWQEQPAAAPAGGRIMSSLARDGGLAGRGGIAGIGGGLAG